MISFDRVDKNNNFSHDYQRHENWLNGEFESLESVALRANKANLALRNMDGTWKELTTTGPENESITLYISKDDMPKQKREFALLKRLFKAIERSNGANPNLYIHKEFRVIKYKKEVLAQVEAESFAKFEAQWIPEVVQKAGLNKEVILKDFYSHTGLAPNHPWSV